MQSSSIIGDIILWTILFGLFGVPILWVLWVAVREYKKTQKGLEVGDKETIRNQLRSVSLLHFIGGVVMAAAFFGQLLGDSVPFVKLVNELGWMGKIIMFCIGAFIYWMGTREFQKADKAQKKFTD